MPIASDMIKNISNPQKTYHVCSVYTGGQKPEQPTKTGKNEILSIVLLQVYSIWYNVIAYSHFSYYFSLNSKFRPNSM